jgi:DNA invertase Pin-like site-specific DNA recombinase
MAAFAAAKRAKAKLVVAKLDRLSRDAFFLFGLQKTGVAFVCADMPDANELTIGIMAVVAQAERKMILWGVPKWRCSVQRQTDGRSAI